MRSLAPDCELHSVRVLGAGYTGSGEVLLAGLRHALDPAGLARVEALGLAEESGGSLTLTERGRFLGGGVTAELLAG